MADPLRLVDAWHENLAAGPCALADLLDLAAAAGQTFAVALATVLHLVADGRLRVTLDDAGRLVVGWAVRA